MFKNLKFHAIAISAICVVVVGLYQLVGPTTPAPVVVQGSDRTIRIASATWGINCNPSIADARQARANAPLLKDADGKVKPLPPLVDVKTNNVLDAVKKLCEGKSICEILANSDVLGLDPADNCFKKLNLNYRCYDIDRLTASETTQGELLKISCSNTAAPNASAPTASQP